MFKLFRKQTHCIKNLNARICVLDGSVRSGKTIASLFAWGFQILNKDLPPGNLAMIGRTYGSIYRNCVEPFIELHGSENCEIKTEAGSNVLLFGGRKIYLLGANDRRAAGKIQGLTLAGAYCDELAIWEYSFFKMLLSRLSIKGARLIATTNPDNPGSKIYVEYLSPERRKALGIKYFHFTIEENEYLDPEYVRSLKKEYTGLYYQRYILGLWVIAEGLIYENFDQEIHYIKKHPQADYYAAAVDYGTYNPFCCGLFGIKNQPKPGEPKIWLERLYYYNGRKSQKQKSDGEYTADLKTFFGVNKPRFIFVDPSASSFITQLKLDGFAGIRPAKNSVKDGISFVVRCLNIGFFRIYKYINHIEEVTTEFNGYIYDEKKAERGIEEPVKEKDHILDMIRYMLFSLFGNKGLENYKRLTEM